MYSYSTQTREQMQQAIQGLINEMTDFIQTEVADGQWRPGAEAPTSLGDYEFAMAGSAVVARMSGALHKALAAFSTEARVFQEAQ
ncbi:hypothetical protein AB0J38_01690 [Streptomyces sp. NPDC050095]|uniref:hypothetical protein n=1 Tax=unclassified Streptomyces TaxID=2593676 RepID=UPI0034162060